MKGAAGSRGALRAVVMFTFAQALLITAIAMVLMRVVWTDDASVRSIQASAWLAVGVQVVTFAIAKLVSRENVIAGWGLGVLLRFAMVAFWAFLGIKALALAETPALMSLVIFFFASTLIEPIFLNI